MTDTTQPPAETHPCWSKRLNRRAHRHWATYAGLQPNCERCGTLIDREHKEIGPVCWTRPVKPGEALVPLWREVQDIHSAAMRDDVTPDEYRTRMIAALTRRAGGDTIGQSDGDPDGWLAVKVNAEGGIVMPYGPLHAGPDRPADPRYRWAPFYIGDTK